MGPNVRRRVDQESVRDATLPRPTARPQAERTHPPRAHSTSRNGHTSDAPLQLDEYYGLDRPVYFFAKIDEFFTGHLPITVSDTANCEPFPTLPNPTAPARDGRFSNEPLSLDQHAYFLRLFWEAYHPIIQIPSESDFRALYDSLWQKTASERHIQGALLDCVTALGMQYGHGADLASRILGSRETGRRVVGDIAWAGFEYFSRCRDYMTRNTDFTLTGMQCYILMALYLLNASDFNTAYGMLGTAVRNAHCTNLHREPDERGAADRKELHRRVWWLLFTLDIRCSLQLRKPVAVQASVITCALPRDGGPDSAYLTHAVKLAIALGNIERQASTIDMCAEASNIAILEHRASTLFSALAQIEHWRTELPPELLSARREPQNNASQAMSTAESPLVLELGVPTWLHRQRVLLEVHYHNAYIMLQRPFICFPRDFNLSQIHQPQTDQHTRSALQHAKVMAVIIHGVCSSSDALLGWPEVLQPLWNATVTMFAFILANPLCKRSPGARLAIDKALNVFETFAITDSLAARAKEVTLSLSSRLDEVLVKLGQGPRDVSARDLIATDEVNDSTWVSAGPTGLMSPLDDDSLRSWIATLDYDEWTDYQNGLDGFLGSPLEDFPFHVPQLPE